jgi:S-adenosylmethionine hydrolase
MFEPCGVVTLTTDFGLRDPFVATMKGQIYTRMPAASIIDVTHEVSVYWPAEAGFWLAHAYKYFPLGCVHIAVVDPGVGTSRRIVVVEADGHVFLAPDNGLLSALVRRATTTSMWQLDMEAAQARFGLSEPSATFHGRDVFAPIAAELAAARARPQELGEAIGEIASTAVAEPIVSDDEVTGVVITIDHFGNVITNIEAALIERFAQPHVHAGGQSFPLRRTYGDVAAGDYVALINSFGVVEIARAQDNAARALGMGRGHKVSVS